MPFYEYRCEHCQHMTVVHAPRIDDAIKQIECAWCQGPMVRVPSAPNFTVQGFNAKNGYSK